MTTTTTYTAAFSINVTGIKTTIIGTQRDVIKEVQWTLVGEQADQKFELPQTTIMPDPGPTGFIQLPDVTVVEVTAWINSHELRMESIKAHIQFVIDQMVSKAGLTTTPMPWAPAVVETTTPAPAPVST